MQNPATIFDADLDSSLKSIVISPEVVNDSNLFFTESLSKVGILTGSRAMDVSTHNSDWDIIVLGNDFFAWLKYHVSPITHTDILAMYRDKNNIGNMTQSFIFPHNLGRVNFIVCRNEKTYQEWIKTTDICKTICLNDTGKKIMIDKKNRISMFECVQALVRNHLKESA